MLNDVVGRIVIVTLEGCQRANQKVKGAPCGVNDDFVSITAAKATAKE